MGRRQGSLHFSEADSDSSRGGDSGSGVKDPDMSSSEPTFVKESKLMCLLKVTPLD